MKVVRTALKMAVMMGDTRAVKTGERWGVSRVVSMDKWMVVRKVLPLADMLVVQ